MKNVNPRIELQEIWQKFTEVQEQILLSRSIPVSIISNSSKIVGDKLYLIADENAKIDEILAEISKEFRISIDDINTENGYFFAESRIARNIDYVVKKRLSERAAANFINFTPYPVIDGYVIEKESTIDKLKKIMELSNIDYSFDRRERLQVSIPDIVRLANSLSLSNINIQIPDTASVVLQVRPNPIFFLSKEFPDLNFNHRTLCHRKKNKEAINLGNNEEYISIVQRSIEIIGGYLNNAVLNKLKDEIGLTVFGYDFTFFVDPRVLSKYDPKTSSIILPELNRDEWSFTFHTSLKDNNIEKDDLFRSYYEEKWDFDLKYTRLKRFFDSYFGSENIKFRAKFIYTYDLYKFDTDYLPKHYYSESDVWAQIYASSDNETVSISESTNSIGMDFNWQNESIDNLIENLSLKYPFLNFNLYKNHKCNVDLQIQNLSLDQVEAILREKFPSIQCLRNDKKGEFYFYQPYQSSEQCIRLRQIIESEINSLNADSFNLGLFKIPESKEKYLFILDPHSQKESLSAVLKELRGHDFNVGKNYFGKLIKVNYPELIFDISGDKCEQTSLLFEKSIVSSINPDVTGDLEKIHRLRNSLDRIKSGENLQNPNLKDFIFDSGKAKKIDDIDYHTNSQSETYVEIENHLLNKQVNDSQKHAIIKTLLAEDLVIIQGPPGTGKSTAIAEIMWQHIRKNANERILLTSETNLAVDNAIDRIVNKNHNLVKPIRFGDEDKLEIEGRQFSLDLMKKWVENGSIQYDSDEKSEEDELLPQKLILQNWIDNIRSRISQSELDKGIFELWLRLLTHPSKELRKIFYSNYLKYCNVVGATCSSIGEKNTRGKPTSFYKNYCEIFGPNHFSTNEHRFPTNSSRNKIYFTTVIQDESSKATPAELSLPLIYGKKNIVIGDHRQLPPLLDKEEFILSFDYLLDRIDNVEERKKLLYLKLYITKHFKEMEISHFERLFKDIDRSLKGVFNLQYRMHPDINDVIKQFYIQDGGLECGLISPIDLGVNDQNMNNPASRYHGIEVEGLISPSNHVIWLDTNSPEMLDGTSRINMGEVDAIRHVLTMIRNSDSFKKYQAFWENPEDQQIGLISFYNKQIKLLRNIRREFNEIPIRVSTVDRFQGMERNIIIVSMVRSNCIASDKKQRADYYLYGELGFPAQNDLGFAQSPNRLNVALSRAKRLLIIVGNSELFRQKEIYDNVYRTIASNPNGRIIKYKAK
ncbi:MAG TPA: AAA domain-containing protein [Bacteroidales bacterium]|mgnify:CR=1 FL=1|nr:AAA domain-containing protein [Bacteroidales bacterium]